MTRGNVLEKPLWIVFSVFLFPLLDSYRFNATKYQDILLNTIQILVLKCGESNKIKL